MSDPSTGQGENEVDYDERSVEAALDRVRVVRGLIDGGDKGAVRDLLADLHVSEAADLISQLDAEDRHYVLNILKPDFDAEMLLYLSVDLRQDAVEHFGPKKSAKFLSTLDSDDALDLIQELDEPLSVEVLEHLSARARRLVEEGLSFRKNRPGV